MSAGAGQAGLAQLVDIVPNAIGPKGAGKPAGMSQNTHPAADHLSGHAADSIREHREHPA